MHPAYSVILFTTASGAGYGLLFWVSLGHMMGFLRLTHWPVLAALVLALALITVGLTSSMAHLGRPERAWRALSQWRSSWLSREGVAAIATYAPAGLLTLFSLTGITPGWSVLLALLSAIGAAVTVYFTGMIYASLRTVRQWNLGLVPAAYMVLAAATGALLLGLVMSLFTRPSAGLAALSCLSLLVGAALKLAYWRKIDGFEPTTTMGAALGLGDVDVQPLERPHTQPNFVMREMGYAVARRHASKLRRIVLVALFALPVLLVLLSLLAGPLAPLFHAAAVVSAAIGVLNERWLFFAEARHLSMIYYDARPV